MIQQKMDKKAYFLGMMNGERLHGELLVSYLCYVWELWVYLNILKLCLPLDSIWSKFCDIFFEKFLSHYNVHFLID